MAETEKAEQPQTNGLENGLDEDERAKLRPADIDADVREMERRKRVEMIMSSKLFREELERIIELQLKDGNGPAGLLQQISDMMGIQSGKLQTTHMFRGSNCVTPINDIRGVESMGYEKGEKNLRCKLASVFRLMDLYGWSQGINNQITARLNQDEEHFLVNPHGMLFNEITASSLVKVDMQGNIVEPGTTNFSVNTQGFLLHSAIHASRPDVNCVIHIKTPSVLAVSSLKCGLLPICQEALVIGEVSQHPFVSGIFEPEEREKIIRNLGPHNKVLLLHNHGAVCCGATVEEAFYNVYNTVLACETQMKLMPIGVENLLLVSDETRKQVYDAAHRAPDASEKKKFRVGEMEFEALIRMLDNAGFRTGYIYRHPLVKGELPKPKNDVEVPPAVSSLGYLIEQEELYKQGNWKKYIDGRNRLDRTKWLNSPNVYQKVEILETGTSDPKKITKWVDQNSEEWVAESSPTHSSTPVKIDSALQFVPKGTNPKEFKKLQQQIKENRRADKITSGPQSHILEGVSWEEAKKLQDANITQTGDQVILVGAASKGIIQRNYQHNALVYKTPYAKNPFDSMSDKEIEDYKQLVERKQRGDTDYEESQSESEAISSSRQDGLRSFKSPLLSPQSATSETEEESRDEPRVLRIETKTAPRPIQAEVVLSDADSDTTDARIERSHSARYPKAEKPESVTLMNSFRKSWSLKREKDKSKDVENISDSRNLHPSLLPNHSGDGMESFHCCVARIKQLTHLPVVVDLSNANALRPLLKSASDPCNLSTLSDDDSVSAVDNSRPGVSRDANTSLSCGNINMSDLQQRLHTRKRLLHSAKMKFLGYHKSDREESKTPTSPMCALISEIRETINEIMSPERSNAIEDVDLNSESMRWIERPKLVSRSAESNVGSKSKASLSKSFAGLAFSPPSENSEKLNVETSEGSFTPNCNCVMHGGSLPEESSSPKGKVDENQNEEVPSSYVVTGTANVSDEEATYTVTDDSLLQTYTFTESTETEWYYNKTIMKLDNSQTVLEIKETDNGREKMTPVGRQTDTGIDTDFTSDRENDPQQELERVHTPKDLEENLQSNQISDLHFPEDESSRSMRDIDTTETEDSDKYCNKTVIKFEDSQAIPQITEAESKNEMAELQVPKLTDTGIDTDFTSEKEVAAPVEEEQETRPAETTEDVDDDAPMCESSGLNKSSETDSSFLKSGSGRTSNDVDTSFAFKTETENSEKTSDMTPEKSVIANTSVEEKKKFFEEMLLKTKETIEEESSDSGEAHPRDTTYPKDSTTVPKLADIPESPEFTNVDTEDAPATSSSKDTSPEVALNTGQLTEDDPVNTTKEPEVEFEEQPEKVRKSSKQKRKKSSTKITVKKEMKEKHTDEPVVSEIRLTIKNSKKCQSEKYEVKIQDVTNTSEELSRSLSSTGENSYESFEIQDGSCDCDAQQSLEELQSEVSSTIEKLQSIENYFEDEIKKHSDEEKKKNGSNEMTIEYNYRELEEVLNESKEERIEGMAELWGGDNESGDLGGVCGEIEILEVTECEDFEVDSGNGGTEETSLLSAETDVEDMAIGSAFVAAMMEAVLGESGGVTEVGELVFTEVVEEGIEAEKAVVESEDVECTSTRDADSQREEISVDISEFLTDVINSLDLQDVPNRENYIDTNLKDEIEETVADVECNNSEQPKEDVSEEQPFEEPLHQPEEITPEIEDNNEVDKIASTEVINSDDLTAKESAERPAENDIEMVKEDQEDSTKCSDMNQSNTDTVTAEATEEIPTHENPPDESPQYLDCSQQSEITEETNNSSQQQLLVYEPKYLPYILTSLKAITFDSNQIQAAVSDIHYILNCLLTAVVKEDKLISSVNEVINFIVTNEESPADSLTEFEDMEKVISNSMMVDAGESQSETEMESLSEAKEMSVVGADTKRKKKEDAIFKVTVATAAKKEIFINYSPEYTSTFNTSADSAPGSPLCNSYIKTDDINDDFDKMSLEIPDFYSIGSPEKNSLDSSFCSAEGNLPGEQFCCMDCDGLVVKSPRSLAIIQEVDEGDSSTSSEVVASSIPE